MNHDILKDKLRKALGDPHYLSKKLREKCRQEVDEVMQCLIPYIQEAMETVKQYNERPCVQTGARRAQAQEDARVAQEDVAEFLWVRYDLIYSSAIPREEMASYIEESVKRLTELYGIELK